MARAAREGRSRARAVRHRRRQCRHGRQRAGAPDDARRLAAHARRQPDRRVPDREAGAGRHGAAQERPDRLRRLDRRPEGLRLCRALCRGQARRRRPDARAGRRDRQDRRHRQRGLSRLRRDRHAGGIGQRIVEKTGRSGEEARASLASANPQGRFIQPEEVAAAVLWLCSDGAGSITGQAISVSGGETW